jgi:hypothetical protein
MPVDYRLNFLGINLEAADINNPVPSTGEVIAITMQLDHVASVDKAILVCEALSRLVAHVPDRISSRADQERAVLDLHLNVRASLPDQARRKPSETISDLKRHACLGRSERMDDPGLMIESPKIVQNCLVRDLSRQANVLRRNPASRWAYKGATPMRRGPGYVRHSVRTHPNQKILCRFLGAR